MTKKNKAIKPIDMYSLKIRILSIGCLLAGASNCALSQVSRCPYDYFETKNEERDYFSFKVRFKGEERLACDTFDGLLFYLNN